MQIIRDISAIKPEPCVATIGFFDGVHAGHRYLIQQVKEIAAADTIGKQISAPSVALSEDAAVTHEKQILDSLHRVDKKKEIRE